MKIHEFVITVLIIAGIGVACVGLGWWAGRAGTQQVAGVQYSSVLGVPISTPPDIRSGRRIRVYLGPEIGKEPAFTIVAGRVYRGD